MNIKMKNARVRFPCVSFYLWYIISIIFNGGIYFERV